MDSRAHFCVFLPSASARMQSRSPFCKVTSLWRGSFQVLQRHRADRCSSQRGCGALFSFIGGPLPDGS